MDKLREILEGINTESAINCIDCHYTSDDCRSDGELCKYQLDQAVSLI